MNSFRYHILEKIIDEVGSDQIDESILEVPPDPELGDFAFPCFILSKTLKKPPQAIAEWLESKIKSDNIIEKVKAAGPYLNFFINKAKLAETVMGKILKEKENYGRSSEPRTVMLEYPSPNTNKPLHLGHIRNMLIGNSVAHLLDFLGNKVIRTNLNNDRGVHICKSMLAYQRWGDNADPDMKSDHYVGKWYVKFAEEAKKDSSLEEQAQDMLRKWEAGDKELIALWEKMNNWAFSGFNKTYEKFGVSFDKEYFESKIFGTGKSFVMQGLKDNLLTKDENGNIIADLEQYNLGKKVVLRADGTSVYATQDIALANQKFQDFPDTDLSIYIVGSEQNYQLKQVFKIFELLKFPFAQKNFHLSYGMVFLPEGKMKSREGTVVDADDILEETISLARSAIELRHKGLSDDETINRATMIGSGALKFFILKNDPSKDMTYDPKESISFEGETGPYVQYVHARIAGIKKKHGKDLRADIDFSLLKTPEEVQLIKLMDQFPETVKDSALKFKPSAIAHYLIDLCQSFNEFYHRRRVVDRDRLELTEARLLLCECVRQVVEIGLGLLGIEAPDEM